MPPLDGHMHETQWSTINSWKTATPTATCALNIACQEWAMRVPCLSLVVGIKGAFSGPRFVPPAFSWAKIIIPMYPVLLKPGSCLYIVPICPSTCAPSVLLLLGLDLCHATCQLFNISSSIVPSWRNRLHPLLQAHRNLSARYPRPI